MANIIQSNLRVLGGNGDKESGIVSSSFKLLFLLIDDETPIVLKSVCEALQLCLPSMVHSTMYDKGIHIYNNVLSIVFQKNSLFFN